MAQIGMCGLDDMEEIAIKIMNPLFEIIKLSRPGACRLCRMN